MFCFSSRDEGRGQGRGEGDARGFGPRVAALEGGAAPAACKLQCLSPDLPAQQKWVDLQALRR